MLISHCTKTLFADILNADKGKNMKHMNEKNLNQLDGCGNVFWNRENEKELLSKISRYEKKRTDAGLCLTSSRMNIKIKICGRYVYVSNVAELDTNLATRYPKITELYRRRPWLFTFIGYFICQ